MDRIKRVNKSSALEDGKRQGKDTKKKECLFHQVHLVLHSTGDILREIHTLCFRVPAPKGSHRPSPPKNTSIAKSTISQEIQQFIFIKSGQNVPVKTNTFFKYIYIFFFSLRPGHNFYIQMCCATHKHLIQCKVGDVQIITRHVEECFGKHCTAHHRLHTLKCMEQQCN